jgi:hypothetical protein
MRGTALIAVLFAIIGCSQPTSSASTDATLKSLTVTGYTLDSSVSADTKDYNVYVPSTVESIAVNAAATDSGASVAYSSSNSSFALTSGPNTLTVTVTAADGVTKKSYTLTVWRCNVKATVLDSANGSLLSSSGLVLKVYAVSGSTETLYASVKASSNPQQFYLVPGSTYTIRATAPGRAQDSKESYTAVEGVNIPLICKVLDQSTFSAASPTIDSFEYTNAADPSADSATWASLSSGSSVDFSSVTGLRVVASATSVIEDTEWGGFGIELGFDQIPSTFSGIGPTKVTKTNSATGTFTTTAIFNVAGTTLTSGSHTVSIVVYDYSNNRTQRDVALTNSVAASSSGTDISGDYFQSLAVDYKIYGASRGYFGKGTSTDAVGTLGSDSGYISYRTAITFKFQDAASAGNAVPILGFKVARSEDGTNFAQIGVKNYGSLSTGASGTHTYYDTDSLLSSGKTYWYKITAFTDDSHTKEGSSAAGIAFLPAYTASLVSPTNKATIAVAAAPDYSFTISDSSLWSSSVSNRFYFAPLIRAKTGTLLFYGEFYYNFAGATDAAKLVFRNSNSYYSVVGNLGGTLSDYITFDAATGLVTLKAALFNATTNWYNATDPAYASGITYEWDLFGQWSGSGSLGGASYMTSSWFQKTSATGIVSKSLADTYENGQQTTNGWFSFTVQ